MPYCEAYNGNGQCSQGHNPKNDCLTSTCWFKYWTSAERAGLKAMGKALRGMMNLCPKNDSNRMIIWGEAVAIRAYVKAARKFKED